LTGDKVLEIHRPDKEQFCIIFAVLNEPVIGDEWLDPFVEYLTVGGKNTGKKYPAHWRSGLFRKYRSCVYWYLKKYTRH
jgi:hypothetical protein